MVEDKLICSRHFDKSDFVEGNMRKRLKFNALPRVLPNPVADLQTEIHPEASTSIDSTSMTDQLLRTSDSLVAGSSSGKSRIGSFASPAKAVKKHMARKRKLISDHSKSETSSSTDTSVKIKETDKLMETSKGEASASSTDSSVKRRRVKFIQTIHSYSISPGKNETSSSTDTSVKIKETDKLMKTSKGEASASSTDSSVKRRRVKFIQTIHSYSISPGKVKRKYETFKGTHLRARKRLYSAIRTIKSLQRKVTSLKTVVDDLRKNSSLSEAALSHLQKGFEDVPHVLMSRYIKNANNGTVTREKYPEKLRNFAATLQFYSTKAYNYVRKTFALALPHISVIRKWCANIDCNPGFCDPSFEALTIKSDMAKRTYHLHNIRLKYPELLMKQLPYCNLRNLFNFLKQAMKLRAFASNE